ncbi:MAG TPA: zinc ribbon domain-containing protein [Bryobacteraceae bacterium]|jgi:putative FmdB family regulatory protein|nr:zinc ribbon domain-containing protein [Bryobacteraceae bacterium]
MPIYEYKCRSCSTEFELLVLRNTVAACPQCQGQDLEQILSGFAVNSEGIRLANAKAARKAVLRSKNYRDEKVAEAEYIKEHDH